MLTEREGRIKDLLASEMGGYGSYAEHRGIKDKIDPDFLQTRRTQLQKSYRLVVALVCVSLIVFFGSLSYALYVQRGINIITNLFSIVAPITALVVAYGQYQKKQMALKVFDILAEAEREPVQV